ncbi:M28 family metallopeptidase [Sphingomonas sp. A2-49]|uniref:M28 family metallopeptidase n=1 Tax=Sphingomonas sp. A2-49 TaxID=1391375 RepID=UPI0021D27F2F|nr:M28 family metallopeptidase [Sphingomonas sp. A2-49]MCU6454452.1 M28 family metallopeptidase [Sphingomonas sp. A2-49]
MIRILGALAALALATSASARTDPAAPLPADQAAMKAHVMFLASDAMKGREAGSPEFDIAAQYVAAQFYAAGLRPAGDAGGYLQRVPLVTYRAADKGAMRWASARAAAQPFAFGVDYVPAADPARAETRVSAPVVFVGRGIVAPQFGVDDYAGVDVRGKIVAMFAGSPTTFPGEERSYFASAATKAQIAAARGAVGIVMLDSPRAGPRQRPFAALAGSYANPRTTWATPAGVGTSPAPSTPVLGTLSQAGATKLFAGSATPWSTIAAQAQAENARYTPVALAGTLTATTRTSFTAGASSNVVGIVPGADPRIGREVVILSAHLDHIGVSPARPGDAPDRDRINNGALDNAIGIASLIEEARRFTASGKPPRRTVMFLAVTGEEKGLIGSSYFVDHPTVPADTIVADVNLDMPVLLYRFEDMIAFGADRSSLGPIVARAVNAVGVGLSPDPMPEQGFFTRSDHFNFVRKGIPSVFLWPGIKGAGKAPFEDFLANRYHRPGDDLNQPILWDQGVRFVATNYAIAREIADGPARPLWNKGDYFGTTYRGPMAQ